jgi:ferrous iron transport protein B
MATRTMKEPKERLVTILVAPLMNCGAKLPVYALLIGAFFSSSKAQMMFVLTFISWALALTAAKIIRGTVLSGPSAPFVLELPPYRMPTLKGLLIHTWERTWMYVKKAGTVILAVSVLLWAMMTFPGLPAEQAASFEAREKQLRTRFLSNPIVSETFASEQDLSIFQELERKPDVSANKEPVPDRFAALLAHLKKPAAGTNTELVLLYKSFQEENDSIQKEMQQTKLMNTIGGRIGIALETVMRPLGFDWRTNVALVGGFAAKEVVVATLGTAYSLGEVNPDESATLESRLQNEPGWNPLLAFTLIIFVMLYNPCFTTLVVIRKESGSWRWTIFAMVYTTLLAYVVALLVKTGGTILRIGI